MTQNIVPYFELDTANDTANDIPKILGELVILKINICWEILSILVKNYDILEERQFIGGCSKHIT